MHLNEWRSLAVTGTRLCAVECQPFDRAVLVHQFQQWASALELPLYLANPGYAVLQTVIATTESSFSVAPVFGGSDGSNLAGKDPLQALLHSAVPGIFLIEGLAFDVERQHQLRNLFESLRWLDLPCHVVLVFEELELPVLMQGMLPTLNLPRPDRMEAALQVAAVCERWGWQDSEGRLTRAVQGLSQGEIDWVLQRERGFVDSADELAERVLDYKVAKLKGRGLEFIGDPDTDAAGMDLLDARLERIVALLDPTALVHNLSFPKGMLLWGLPGTGKSLSAKLAAKKMGVPLLAADWNGLRGATPTESLQNLRFLLDTADSMAPCVLYFDDFDKGFAGWDTDMTSKQSAQRLLTWMQEHTSAVFVLATVNRLGMLPVELQRRLPDVFFFDLPHDGARYDIFRLHLAKYFPAFQRALTTEEPIFSDEQWRELLTEYRLCIPDEIGNAVKRVAEEVFYCNFKAGNSENPLEVTFEQLLAQRSAFTPVLVREEGPMLEIRNNATYAKPVSSPDVSRFARPKMELFE